MGIKTRLQTLLVTSAVATATTAVYVRARIANVECVNSPASVSTYCARYADSPDYDFYAYRVRTLLPGVYVAQDVFDTVCNDPATAYLQRDGRKVVTTHTHRVPGLPVAGSLYALQALQHAYVLRAQRSWQLLRAQHSAGGVAAVWRLLRSTSLSQLAATRRALHDACAHASDVEACVQQHSASAATAGGDLQLELSPQTREATLVHSTHGPAVGVALARASDAPANTSREVTAYVYYITPKSRATRTSEACALQQQQPQQSQSSSSQQSAQEQPHAAVASTTTRAVRSAMALEQTAAQRMRLWCLGWYTRWLAASVASALPKLQ